MSVRAQPSFIVGIVGACSGWNDHQCRVSSVILSGSVRTATPVAGQGAPILIQSFNTPISSSESLPPLGGILISPVWCTACSSRLLSGSPGTIAGPESPPLIIASREIICSPPAERAWWHNPQRSARIGRTLPSKYSSPAPPFDAAAVSTRPAGFVTSASSQMAPAFTHWVSAAISPSVSLWFLGGIFRSPVCITAWISRLLSGLPGTIAGPESPPLRMPARESSRSPPISSDVWHL